ncbi:hypothetical protein DV737_g2771, partial [Chaetothyriales sp. CBS 132003]
MYSNILFEFLRQILEDQKNLVIGLIRDKAATEKKIAAQLSDRANVHNLHADLTKYATLKQAATDTADIVGERGVDYLVANAGLVPYLDICGPIGALSDRVEEVEAVSSQLLQTNVVGNIHLFHLFLPLVLKGKVKKVITISSGITDLDFINGYDIDIGALYAASKAAVNVIVAKFKAQYKKDGVLFMSISPATPEEIQAFAEIMGKLVTYALTSKAQSLQKNPSSMASFVPCINVSVGYEPIAHERLSCQSRRYGQTEKGKNAPTSLPYHVPCRSRSYPDNGAGAWRAAAADLTQSRCRSGRRLVLGQPYDMSRLQDSVIDDDDDCCPLCVEEFDLADKSYRPCPCGYLICQFCFNSLKTTYDAAKCPNCRRPYDEKTIEYKVPSPEEQKQDQLNRTKRAQAAKRKDAEKREVEASSRRNLAGVRVKQQNLVYVIGLVPQMKDEQTLLQTLRGPDYFGQYGEVEKIVVSKAKPGAPNQGVGVYVTYARKEDAALCIHTIDGTQNGDRTLRAQFGTTKYCSAFLRHETCTNKNCSFLHEAGDDGPNSGSSDTARGTKQPPAAAAVMAPPQRPQSTTHSVSSQPMARQGSKDSDSRKASGDGSALPSTASWAHSLPIAAKVRRPSQSTSRATPSPQLAHAALVSSHKSERSKDLSSASAAADQSPKEAASKPRPKPKPKAVDPIQTVYDALLKTLSAQPFEFIFSDASLSGQAKADIESFPCLIDPYGGAKRRVMQNREAERANIESEEKAKLEVQATSAAEDALDDESMGAGSLALGGEPEDNPRSTSARAPGPTQNTSYELSNFDRSGPQYSQAQYDQISNHQRHGSRYFNHDSKASNANNRFQTQQQQQSFYPSGVQGPPPGLPASGTPPVSGGGMFAHGQNFTNPGFSATKDANADLHPRGRSTTGAGGADVAKRELLLSLQNNPLRSPPQSSAPASSPGFLGGQYPGPYQDPGLVKQRKKGKKQRHANTSSSGGGVEHLADPSIVQARIHQAGNTAQGLFGGQQVHGVMDLLLHRFGRETIGLWHSTSHGFLFHRYDSYDEAQFPPLPARPPGRPPGLHSRVTSFPSRPGSSGRSTPKVPPGFENTHGHPILKPEDLPTVTTATSRASTTAPVLPALPTLSRRTPTSTSRQDKSHDDKAGSSTLDKGRSADISLGSPKPRQPRVPPKEQTSQAIALADKEVKSDTKVDSKHTADLPSTKPALPKSKDAKSDKPMKIDVSAMSTTSALSSHDKLATPASKDAATVATPPPISSRPATPATVASELSRASIPKTRTLRVATSASTSSRPVEQPPHSATTERSGPASLPPHHPLKSASRRPSVSSISKTPVDSASYSRPSTPAMSEKLMSEGVSRAGSPPVSIVGSAPERAKTRNQLKKERRDKAKAEQKTADAISSSTSVATPPVAEEVGPIVSRQKKQKKATTETKAAADNHSKVAKTTKAKQQEDTKEVEPSQPSTPAEQAAQEIEPDAEEATEPFTLRDLYASLPANHTSADIQRLLQAHTSSMSRILSSLLSTGDLTKDHPWLNPPSFNSPAYKLPPDNRKGQDYLDAHGYTQTSVFGYVYLPVKERRALERGSSVGVASTPPPPLSSNNGSNNNNNNTSQQQHDSLLHRALITAKGVVYRHLTPAESERLLELEERRDLCVEEFGEDIGSMSALEEPLEETDFINLAGGMEELARRGEDKGVVWVDTRARGGAFVDLEYDDADIVVDDDDAADEEEDYPAEPDDLVDIMGHGGRSRHPTISSTNSHDNPVINLRALDDDALTKRVTEKQKELEAARKEMDKSERSWNKKAREWARWRDATVRA